MGAYRKYIPEDADMQTMLFRYAVMVSAFNSPMPDEVKCSRKFSPEVQKKLLKEQYSEQNDRAVMLFGMGVIDEETAKNLILFNKSEWLNDAIALENRVRRDEEREIETDCEQLCGVFTVCANSRKYSEINGVDFESAEKILSYPNVKAVNGFIRVSAELLAFMNSAGIGFGFYDEDNDELRLEKSEYISQAATVEDYDFSSEKAPIPFDYNALRCCLAVFGKNYAADFLDYARENNIPFSDSFAEEYEKYLSDVKLCFDIKAYKKKRDICGDKINFFDYSLNIMENGMLADATLEEEAAYSAAVRADTETVLPENELEEIALKRYLKSHQPTENMVIEVFHCKKISLYFYRDGKLERLTEEQEKLFRSQLFDFNEIWTVIKECSDSGLLRRNGDAISIPTEFMERIRPEWQNYAVQIIKEQFGRRKRNMIAATLNELKQAAAQKAAKKSDNDAENSAKKRKPSIMGYTKNNENGGN